MKNDVYKYKVYLDGISCEDGVEIDLPECKIRRINKSDRLPNPQKSYKEMHSSLNPYPLTILEGLVQLKKDISELKDINIFYHFEFYINPIILRLYKVGSVFIHSIELYDYDSGKIKRKIELNHGKSIRYRKVFDITKKDKEPLAAFFKKFKEPLILSFFPEKNQRKFDHINHIFAALEMYNNAFINIGPVMGRVRHSQSQISFLMSTLEALYSRKEENESITRSLRQRTALVLSHFNFKALEIYSKISKLYSFRSDYLHGNVLNYKKLEKKESKNRIKNWENRYKNLDSLTEEAFEFARISLLIFLGLRKIDYIEKDNFLNLIDKTLVDNRNACVLGKTLNEIKKILIWEEIDN
jgi:hypothetical protein